MQTSVVSYQHFQKIASLKKAEISEMKGNCFDLFLKSGYVYLDLV